MSPSSPTSTIRITAIATPSSKVSLRIAFVVSSLSHGGKNERVSGYLVSGNYFDRPRRETGARPRVSAGGRCDAGFASRRRPELWLLGAPLRFQPRHRRPDGAVQWPPLHRRGRRAERLYRHGSRLHARDVDPDDDGGRDRARLEVARAPRRATISSSSAASSRA